MFSLKSLGKNIVQKSFARSLFCQPLRTYLNQDTQRFFMVTYNFAEGVDSQLAYSWEEHRKKVDALEKEGKILFGGTSTSRESEYFLFNCKDETTPYDFIKSDPYYVNGTVSNYKIEEVEVGVKEDTTQVTKFNQYR